MGRARAHQAAVVEGVGGVDGFTAVFGSRRGGAARDQLSVTKLSPVARLRLRALIAAAKAGRLDEPLAVIAREHEHLQLPHLKQLVEVCANSLAESVCAASAKRTYAALDLTGIHRRIAAQIIYVLDPGQMHLWPQGNSLTPEQVRELDLYSPTACGIDVRHFGAMLAGVPRGDWRTFTSRNFRDRICAACEKHASKFWETEEKVTLAHEAGVLPPAELAHLHEGVLREAVSLLGSGECASSTAARAQLTVDYNRHVVAQARDIYKQNPEWVLRRLPNEGYARMRKFPIISKLSGPLSEHLRPQEYGEVVELALARDIGVGLDADEAWVLMRVALRMSDRANT
jgi:hypothetical protein